MLSSVVRMSHLLFILYLIVVVKGKCILTPINPTTLTSTGGTLPNGTESVMIQCNCTNDDGIKINHVRWYDPDGNKLLRSGRFNDDVPYFTRVTDRDNTNVILVIPIFTSSFDGIYTCGRRVNRGLPGPPSASINLTIDVNIPVITMQPMDAAIQLITNFTNHTLTCKADKASSYHWEKENDVIPSDSTGVYTNALTLVNLQPKDAGNYRCVATNAIRNGKSDYAMITIFVHAPRVISHPTSTYAASPFGAIFSCSIQVYGYLTITWYRSNRNPVQNKASFTVKHSIDVTTSVLYIPNVTSEDVNTYFCEAWANRMAARSLDAKLFLTVPPPQPPVVMTDTAINLTVDDYNLTMKCLPYQSNFDYKWIKGNESSILPIRSNVLPNSSQLTIVNLKPEDSGSYQCVMSNSSGTISSSFVMVNIRASLPTISEQPNNMTIHIFESVSFNCTARGFGLLEIIWKRIRHAIPVTAEITQVKSLNEITSVIKISTTVGYYSGQYYCIAKNEVGETISRIANLNVIVPLPEIIICPKDVTVFPNDNFTMNCLALSFGSIKYHWNKNEGMLSPTAKMSFKYISQKATNVYNLKVFNVKPSDEGLYCCKAVNEAGSAMCCAWLEVSTLPSITTQPIPEAFKLGDVNVTAMSCSAVGMGPMHFQWEKYDSLNNSWISPSHRALNIMSSDLKFSVITEDDEGVYHCIVTNNDGSVISDNATIHVYGPPIIKFITNHTVKQEGQKVDLICGAVNDFDAVHPLQINWYKGNKLVIQIERQVVLYIAPDNVSREQNLTLTIDQVNHTDDGEYTCRAFNHNNSFSELKTNLTVQSPPIISITNESPYKTSVDRFAVLHCTATGKPIPIVEWYINDNIIKNPFPTIPHSSRGSRLLLVPTHKPDTIIYACKGVNYIENIKYTSSASITVTVEEN